MHPVGGLNPVSRSFENDDVLAGCFPTSSGVKDRAEVAHAQPRVGDHFQKPSLLIGKTRVGATTASPANACSLIRISKGGHASRLEEKRRQEQVAAWDQYTSQLVQIVLRIGWKQMREE
jgi:hypothetical protein